MNKCKLDLSKLTKKKLLEKCKLEQIKGCSGKTKIELVNHICQTLHHKTRSGEKYTNKVIYKTRTGRIYIRVAHGEGKSQIQQQTAKAIKVSGYGWVPRSVSFIRGNDPRYHEIFVLDSFYDEHPVEEKLTNERIMRIEKEMKETDEAISDLVQEKKNRKMESPNPEMKHLSNEDIEKAISYFQKEKQKLIDRIDEEKSF